MHFPPLIVTLVASLGFAFFFGAIANRLRMPPLAGYLVAGIVVGPFTPGFVADQAIALELAEIGVILLMFGVGLHFSLDDLLAVKAIAVPGAIVQIAIATLLGMGLAWWIGWPLGTGVVFGLALSVASTVVLLRALEERRLVETDRGRIAVGWLIVEDLAMVLALVVLPAIAPLLGGSASGGSMANLGELLGAIGATLLRVAAFIAFMLIVGRRIMPWLLHYIVHTGSRELFALCVLSIALGVALGSAALFGVSFALGAFFAGMVLAGSTLTQRAAEETLPLRDAFAVVFFVSVGMLFDPTILLRAPWAVLGTFLIIVLGKSIGAYAIVRAFRRPPGTALMISASLAQIGEFSFILAGMGIDLGLLTTEGRDLILAGAILSILFNPVAFALVDRYWKREKPAGEDESAKVLELEPTHLTDHAVIVGYGRVGSIVGKGLIDAGQPVLVVEDRDERVTQLRGAGVEVLFANAADRRALNAANLSAAKWLFVAIPNTFEAQRIVVHARAVNPDLVIIARAHFDDQVEDLKKHGADVVIMGEREIARGMLDHVLGGRGGQLPAATR